MLAGWRAAALLALAFAPLTWESPASAQSVEQFYKGRTITVIVPNSAGGNYDLNTRLVARHLGAFIPGHPAIAVENQPGAGGLILANRLANTIEADGLTLGVMERGTPQIAYEGDPNAKFDPLSLTWLGSLSSYASDAYLLLVNASNPARSVADLKGGGVSVKLGGDQAGSTNLTFALLARDLLHLNIQVVRGYPGAAPIFVAMQSGELDGQVIGLGSVRGAQAALWTGKQVRPLLAFGRTTRLPELPDTPIARELVSNPNDLALLTFAEIPFFIALPFAGPPKMPPDRAKALASAFMAMTKDAAFVEDARRANFELSPIDGDAVRGYIERMAATPKDVIKRYVALIRQ